MGEPITDSTNPWLDDDRREQWEEFRQRLLREVNELIDIWAAEAELDYQLRKATCLKCGGPNPGEYLWCNDCKKEVRGQIIEKWKTTQGNR